MSGTIPGAGGDIDRVMASTAPIEPPASRPTRSRLRHRRIARITVPLAIPNNAVDVGVDRCSRRRRSTVARGHGPGRPAMIPMMGRAIFTVTAEPPAMNDGGRRGRSAVVPQTLLKAGEREGQVASACARSTRKETRLVARLAVDGRRRCTFEGVPPGCRGPAVI